MNHIIIFVSVFLIIYLVYFIFVINRKKSIDKWKKGKELTLLKYRYKLNYDKINIKSLAHVIGLANAFIISSVVTIISFFKGFLMQMLIGFVILIPLILIVYHLIGKYYQNKQRRIK